MWNDCCELCPTSTSYTSDVTVSLLSCRSKSLEVLAGNLANSSGSSSHLTNVFCVPFCALSSHVNLFQRPRTSIFPAATPPSLPPPAKTREDATKEATQRAQQDAQNLLQSDTAREIAVGTPTLAGCHSCIDHCIRPSALSRRCFVTACVWIGRCWDSYAAQS